MYTINEKVRSNVLTSDPINFVINTVVIQYRIYYKIKKFRKKMLVVPKAVLSRII
jgi:hypothetical protein